MSGVVVKFDHEREVLYHRDMGSFFSDWLVKSRCWANQIFWPAKRQWDRCHATPRPPPLMPPMPRCPPIALFYCHGTVYFCLFLSIFNASSSLLFDSPSQWFSLSVAPPPPPQQPALSGLAGAARALEARQPR